MKALFQEMFSEIAEIIDLDEIAYLGIKDGELIPIYKNDTKDLSLDDWIKFHTEYRSFVKDSPFLTELVEQKKKALIHDTNQLEKKPVEFQVLNICSIYLFPIVHQNTVIGILDIAYRNKHYVIDNTAIDRIESIALKYTDRLSTL